MNPEKLFAYLEGTLPANERAALDARIAADPALQRELEIARAIHERGHGAREVVGSSLPEGRGALIGRRVAIGFAVLVFLNVAFGIIFIAQKQKKPSGLAQQEAAMRQQLAASLERSANSILPPPRIGAEEIAITASAAQRDIVADRIVAAAAECGGAGTKALPEENGIVVLAEVPANRKDEFRRKLVPFGVAPPTPAPADAVAAPAPGEKQLFQVRINTSGTP